MALSRSSLTKEVGLQLLFCPLGSNIIVQTACCSVGVALPVYSTFKAIERKDEDEQQKWLMYWAAYGTFSIAEVFADKFITWFPMYHHLKFAVLVWLQLPSTDGASQLCENYLSPFLLRCQAKADQRRATTHAKFDQPRAITQAKVGHLSSIKAEIKCGEDAFFAFSGQIQINLKDEMRLKDLDGITLDTDTESDLEVEDTFDHACQFQQIELLLL